MISLATVSLLVISMQSFASYGSPGNLFFVDAYFGEDVSKLEVDPGDSRQPLLVLVINRRAESITGISGVLHLPEDFREHVKGTRDAGPATYLALVASGGSFNLRFLVDIKSGAKIASYTANLKVEYFWLAKDGKWETGSDSLDIEFRVTGRGVLSARLETPFLIPGIVNPLKIIVSNRGSTSATRLEVSVESPRTPQLAFRDSVTKWLFKELGEGKETSIELNIYASIDSANRVFSLPLTLNYLDAYGQQKVQRETLDLQIGANQDDRVRINADLRVKGGSLQPGSTDHLTITIVNEGRDTVYALEASLNLPELVPAPLTLVGSSGYWLIPELLPREEKKLETSIHAGRNAAGAAFQLRVSLSFKDKYENAFHAQRVLGIRVAEETARAAFAVSSTQVITAGRTEKIILKLTDLQGRGLRDVVATIRTNAEWITLLDRSRWHVGSISPSGEAEIVIPTFASDRTATGSSTLGRPITITVEIEYTDAAGTSRREVQSVGALIRGLTTISLMETSIQKIDGQLYLAGTLINEGNEEAIFTRVRIKAGADSVLVPLKETYIGDLGPNSPLSFNIPISARREITDQSLPVTIEVSFKDSLREEHTVEVRAQASVDNSVLAAGSGTEATQGFLGQQAFSAAVVLIVVLVAAVLFIRRFRGSNKKQPTR